MKNIIDFLNGKKTYIVGILMILLGLLQSDTQTVLNGLAIITGRVAIAKIQ